MEERLKKVAYHGLLKESLIIVFGEICDTGISTIEIVPTPENADEISQYIYKKFGEEWDALNLNSEAQAFVDDFEDQDLLEEEEGEDGLDVVEFFEKYKDYDYEKPKNPLNISQVDNKIHIEVESLSYEFNTMYDELPNQGLYDLDECLKETKSNYPEIEYLGYVVFSWSGGGEEYIYASKDYDDVVVYQFIAKQISRVIDSNPEEFCKEVNRIIGTPIDVEEDFSEEWKKLEPYLTKESLLTIDRLKN